MSFPAVVVLRSGSSIYGGGAGAETTACAQHLSMTCTPRGVGIPQIDMLNEVEVVYACKYSYTFSSEGLEVEGKSQSFILSKM